MQYSEVLRETAIETIKTLEDNLLELWQQLETLDKSSAEQKRRKSSILPSDTVHRESLRVLLRQLAARKRVVQSQADSIESKIHNIRINLERLDK